MGESETPARGVAARRVNRGDAEAWLRMRVALWPEGPEEEHREEIARYFAGEAEGRPAEVLMAETDSGRVAGFAELSIRPYAEGCRGTRVAYLEGWYVEPELRCRGIGRALVAASEVWARSQGCEEFASDAQPDNEASIAAHRAAGFTDAGLVRCFRKDL